MHNIQNSTLRKKNKKKKKEKKNHNNKRLFFTTAYWSMQLTPKAWFIWGT